MNKDRRAFISQLSVVAAVTALNKPTATLACVSKKIHSLYASGNNVTIYNTNDLHGNLEPVMGSMGGLNQIQTALNKQEFSGVLLDSGDFLNTSKSVPAQKNIIRAMNSMGYHAASIGNEELAMGQDHLASLAPLMQFSLVNCNYRFDGELNNWVKPFIIINSGKYKIGITGVGHKLKGIKYNDAIESVNKVALQLKENEKCDLVICLSHLGYKQTDDRPDDKKLAAQSAYIDMIVSGHNHFLLNGPVILRNKLKQEVIISLAAYNGLMLGRTIFNFENGKQKFNIRAKSLVIGGDQDFTGLKANEKLLMNA
jgi:5'-nucleotidase